MNTCTSQTRVGCVLCSISWICKSDIVQCIWCTYSASKQHLFASKSSLTKSYTRDAHISYYVILLSFKDARMATFLVVSKSGISDYEKSSTPKNSIEVFCPSFEHWWWCDLLPRRALRFSPRNIEKTKIKQNKIGSFSFYYQNIYCKDRDSTWMITSIDSKPQRKNLMLLAII